MIQAIEHISKFKVTSFFIKHWGSTEMVISTGVFKCDELDGFAYIDEKQEIIGLVTYDIRKDECEIISLDSIQEGKGIGNRLMKEVENLAAQKGCTKITLITTNDNINALKFYQKRGYRLIKVFPNAVGKARKVKKSIPLIGYNGIPLTDELKLQKVIKN